MAGYGDVLTELRAELAKVDRSRERLQTAIGAIEELAKAAQPRASIVADYSKMTVREGAIHILKTEGRSMETTDIVARLKAGGKQQSDMYNSTYTALARESEKDQPRVVRDGKLWKAV